MGQNAIADEFKRRYDPSPWASVRGAMARARAALEAGESHQALAAGQRLRANQVPRGEVGQTAYRYNVAVRWSDPETGVIRSTMLTFRTAAAQTQQQIEAAAAAQFQAAMAGTSRQFGSKEVSPGSVLGESRVITVERA